jgi:hypothetical protein
MKYATIAYLSGDEAQKPLSILRERGVGAALVYLSQWDYGDEPQWMDGPPWGSNDARHRVPGDTRHIVVANPGLDYISLVYVDNGGAL